MNEPENLFKIRHSCEHVFNQALEELYPGKVKRAIGPTIDNGWYFDGRLDFKISEEDFPKIEKRMSEIIKADLPITMSEISEAEARELFKDNPFKQELITEFVEKGEKLTVYKTGEVFTDLCAGPHVKSTGEIKAFKLLSIAGAYWRGNEKNEMLTRIYGTAFESQVELDEYLKNLEESKKRDHRKIGKELGLFTFSELIGSGLPLYTPKGALIRRLLTWYVEELQSKEDYMQVWTPQIAKADLFKKSGHYDKYKEDMFRVVSNYSEEEFFLKPMNCPQHTQIYASELRSYRDLPIRMTDFAMLYRDERPGELNGLARVRAFSQDDCHIFCTEEQVDQEIDKALKMTQEVMEKFGFKYKYRLSTRDPKNLEKYLGDPKTWDKVEAWAVKIMERNNIPYFDGPGEAAFYAPKMDLIATDALGREWQLSTVQIDYVMPERFNLVYTDSDGKEKHPIMLHRAIMGSPERFIMIILEHFAGNLPLWLCPTQVSIIPVSIDKHLDYAEKIAESLKSASIRTEISDANETLGNRIRKAQNSKIPYVVVVGDKEIQNSSVNIRMRGGESLGEMSMEKFINRAAERITSKALDL